MQCTQTHVLVCNRTHSNVTVLGVLLYTVVLVEKGFFFPSGTDFFLNSVVALKRAYSPQKRSNIWKGGAYTF